VAQSLSNLLVHLIFSTKDRFPFLHQSEMLSRTHAYLGGILRDENCPSIKIGGTADHVHVFFHQARTQAVSSIVETLKSQSSRWIKTQGIDKFAWQRGYGCFSIGQSQSLALIRYIENQAEHHRKITFQEEFLKFLRRYEIAADERYLWD
jgi:putative transposase